MVLCARAWRRLSSHADAWVYWQSEPGVWRNRWREVCEDPKLLPHLQTLPADAYKVEADGQMVAVYWAERGEAEVLQRIDKLLRELA